MKLNRNKLVLSVILALAAASAPVNLAAGTTGFVAPSFRGSANTEFGYWEMFTVPIGAPGNLPDQSGATTIDARLTQTDPGAFLTGSGNIYDLATSSFILSDSTPYTLGTVVMQARTLGSEIAYNTVSMTYSNESGLHSLAPLFRYETDRSAGGVSFFWQWNLTGLGATSYSVSFSAGGTSLSFDSLMLDTSAQFTNAFQGQPFKLQSIANLARWNYPFNGAPANREAASVFGALGSSPDFDARDAQYLLGWNTTNLIPTGLGATNYQIRRARVTLTIASGNYTFTGTPRDYRSYFPTNDPRYVAPTSVSTPVELFGAGFRGGFTNQASVFVPYASTNYPQAGPWGILPGQFHSNRVAYAAGFNTNGVLIDISNNVGDDETNEIAGPFEIAPFAYGQSTNATEGQVMVAGDHMTFEINLADPLIYGYLQKGLHEGNLSFMVASLINASLGGPITYPNFYTSFSPLADPDEMPLLDIEGGIIRPSVDSDADGLPDGWENFQFGSLANAATDDTDGDTASNLAEYRAGTIASAGTNLFKVLSVKHAATSSELRFHVAPSRQYTIQQSDDLSNWQTVANPAVTYSSDWLSKSVANPSYPSPVYGVWRDTNAASSNRFYRVGAQ